MRTAHNIQGITAIPLTMLHGAQYADRLTDPEAVQRIADHYDARLMEPIKVRLCADGSYEVVEGRHRAAAFKLRGELYIIAEMQRPETREAAPAQGILAVKTDV